MRESAVSIVTDRTASSSSLLSSTSIVRIVVIAFLSSKSFPLFVNPLAISGSWVHIDALTLHSVSCVSDSANGMIFV